MFANNVFCASTLKGLIDHLQILLHLFPSRGGDNEFRDIGKQDFVRLYLTLSYLILAEYERLQDITQRKAHAERAKLLFFHREI